MATTDVANKCIAANSIKNGSVVVTADKIGNYDSIDPRVNKQVTPESMESKWTERYDTPEELM